MITPRPERVTLTDEEYGLIDGTMADASGSVLPMATRRTVERILTAREQALREEIAGEIEAHGALWDHSADWRCGVDEAADIARGTVR